MIRKRSEKHQDGGKGDHDEDPQHGENHQDVEDGDLDEDPQEAGKLQDDKKKVVARICKTSRKASRR